MGNAVCPMVASALGRCLALAVAGEASDSLEQAVVSVPDPDFVQVRALPDMLSCERASKSPIWARLFQDLPAATVLVACKSWLCRVLSSNVARCSWLDNYP